jgi:hypothetical protein
MPTGYASEHAASGERRHKFGVLLVHGIGEQPEGDTLLTFGEPLIRWLRRWVSRKHGNRLPGGINVIASYLTPSKLLRQEPAHTLIEVSPGGDGIALQPSSNPTGHILQLSDRIPDGNPTPAREFPSTCSLSSR